jgi:geranylgeranyl diphosphate synthase type I
MKNDIFYKQFITAFESKFQTVVSQIFKNSSDTSFDSSLIETFQEPLDGYLTGGKRIRPFLIAVGANSLDEKVIDAGIAFELIHTFALIHDDIMDGATMRRDVPTVHTFFDQKGYSGQAGAILLGDFVLVAANEYVNNTVPELMPLFSKMQRFLCIGQFYEMIHWGKDATPEISEKISRFKSAQYSFMYPIQIGLEIAGRNPNLLNDYADASGLAFQVRDDWLDISEDENSGKDHNLDSMNSVPNIVQQIFKSSNDLAITKTKVEAQLQSYKQKALDSLNTQELTESQRSSLTALLEFSTTI